MVIGVGIDSIEIARVANSVQRNPRLQRRLFTPRELAELPPGEKAWSRMAAVFAAKEAVFKAFGTGLARHSWQQVEVVHDRLGAPRIELNGKAAATADRRKIVRLHISISHDRERAVAICIAEGGEQCSG